MADVPLTSAEEIVRFGGQSGRAERDFDVSAKVVIPSIVPMRIFSARVGDRIFTFGVNRRIARLCPTNVGERVRLRGQFRRQAPDTFTMDCQSIETVGYEPPERPLPITARQFYADAPLHHLVSISGTVRNLRLDEIDPDYCFLTLNCDGEIVYVALCVADADPRHLARLPGADITAVGLICPEPGKNRSLMGRTLSVSHASDISIRAHGTDDVFDVPSVADLRIDRPSELLTRGRCRAVGTVLAVWNGASAILKADDGRLVRVDFGAGSPPAYGNRIEVSGFPETNFANLCLTGAVWREASGTPLPEENPRPVDTTTLFLDADGRTRYHPEFNGEILRLRGTVVTPPRKGQFTLSMGSHTLLVDASERPEAVRALAPETLVEVTGTCVIDAENWRADFSFPQIRSVLIVPRKVSDVRILRRPPWWTPLRFATVIGSLLVALLAILIWNRSLRRLAAKRGRELADKTIAQAESELKVYERTRLATELHDSIAQILTGVSFKLETADRLAETDPKAMRSHLGIAIRSLQACRDDLRNCLWDLRNHALEIPDMDKAIRRTLEQHLEGTDLAIRFNVPRERLSDNTTHEILCIIRELVLNAIRHGHATEVRVAGAIEDNTLRFSVADNGCGFDPDGCPGMREGHYGLQGVRERAAHLGGEFTIRPNGAAGMKAVVSIKITQSP